MTILQLTKQSLKELKGIKHANLDSELILGFILKKPREYILSHPEQEVCAKELKKFEKLINRRQKHEPIAYLINKKEFYGREFFVDKNVHIPKSATETMIDEIKNANADFKGIIADIGTGSGCVAITLAIEFPKAKILATDISKNAIKIARINAKKQKIKNIFFINCDILPKSKQKIGIIAANLPYGWKAGWTKDKEVPFQPKKSYIAGKDGLLLIKKLIKQIPRIMKKTGTAFLEFDPRQTKSIIRLAKDAHLEYKIKKDMEGYNRIIVLKLTSDQKSTQTKPLSRLALFQSKSDPALK